MRHFNDGNGRMAEFKISSRYYITMRRQKRRMDFIRQRSPARRRRTPAQRQASKRITRKKTKSAVRQSSFQRRKLPERTARCDLKLHFHYDIKNRCDIQKVAVLKRITQEAAGFIPANVILTAQKPCGNAFPHCIFTITHCAKGSAPP